MEIQSAGLAVVESFGYGNTQHPTPAIPARGYYGVD
jgi:hypothetical protein